MSLALYDCQFLRNISLTICYTINVLLDVAILLEILTKCSLLSSVEYIEMVHDNYKQKCIVVDFFAILYTLSQE